MVPYVMGNEPVYVARSSFNWRLIPAICAVVASCIAGSAFLAMHRPYLAIPCALGAVTSLYFFYLAKEFRHLKNLEENNDVHEAHNALQAAHLAFMQEQNRRYAAENGRHAQHNDEQARQIGALTALVEHFDGIAHVVTHLHVEGREIERARTNLDDTIKESRTEGHAQRVAHEEAWSAQLGAFVKVANVFEGAMQQKFQELQQFVSVLLEWSSDAEVARRRAEVRALHAEVDALRVERGYLTGVVDALRGLSQDLGSGAQTIASGARTFATHVPQLLEATQTMQRLAGIRVDATPVAGVGAG